MTTCSFSSGTSREAKQVELAELEQGEAPTNTHLRISSHLALYGASVYEYEESKYSSGAPSGSAKVNHCYYPIYSVEHPVMVAFANEEEIDEAQLGTFAVMVKTKRFKTVNSIPDGIDEAASVQGLVINRIGSLDSEEKKLVKQSFPTVNFDKVLILEEGRKPSSLLITLGMLLGGLALIVVGVGLFFLRSD